LRDAGDFSMGLTEYRRKRNFQVTREPRGGREKSGRKLSFAVQKHAASHLHYDFRLELNGVLLSWAVPKGPSLDPAQKRLAMHVEDHPLEYGSFEGLIPQGEYGGGTVLLWDQGTWTPIEEGEAAYRAGSLKFELHGEKLNGRWMLVRRGGRRSDSSEKHWFLFKERDEFARPGYDVAAKEPLSVTSGRDMDEIAADADRVWESNGKKLVRGGKGKKKAKAAPRKGGLMKSGTAKPAKKRKALSATAKASLAKSLRRVGRKRASMPAKVAVQLATLAADAPRGDTWLHEIKFDGYRMLCRIRDGKATLISRNGKDWTAKFGALPAAAAQLPVTDAILDGEVVVLEPDGRSSFQALQQALRGAEPAPFAYYAFDLLYLNGYDVTAAAIEDRKALLKTIVHGRSADIVFSDHVIGNGEGAFDEAAKLGLEGIISKRLGQPYVGGRGTDWLKVKCSLREEFVIGGFTKPEGARSHFGALLLGYYDRAQQLVYAGRVGTGFDEATLGALHERFRKLIRRDSPFSNLRGTTGQARGVTWLEPKLVGQVQFSNWTEDRQLRHPSFQGLREDKAAGAVVRDDPVAAKSVTSTKRAVAMGKSTRASRKGSPRRGRAATKSGSSRQEVAGVSLSHPDKVLYPDAEYTKLDLAAYYETVASWMLPHVGNRLLSLVRCPAGSDQKCFFQKHPWAGLSDAVKRFDVRDKSGVEEYMAVTDVAGLVSLVQMSVLEIHAWGSLADQFERPDRLIFDLDPDPAVKWPDVVRAAKDVRVLLDEIGLESFVKTTGGKGLHIVVPIQRRTSWDDAKSFCRAVAEMLATAAPDRYVATMSKAARKGKIFVDYLRNDRGATAVAPYSTRARPGATVSVPIAWDELSAKLKSDHYTIKNVPGRLSRLKIDPWAGIGDVKQSITAPMLKRVQRIV
jgi:bifunctional non-homologous end joining protein LigD